MITDMGKENVSYFEGAGATHSFVALPAWIEPEAARACDEIGDFLKDL